MYCSLTLCSQARRQLQAAGCLSEGESVASLGIGPPLMLGGPTGLMGDRGSCSADSGVRGYYLYIIVVVASVDRRPLLGICLLEGLPTTTM